MADDNTGQISPEHREFLAGQAVDIALAESLGVRSLLTRADNPQEGVWGNWANFPALLFPWTSPTGRVEYQVRPDNPTNDAKGRPRKYAFAKDAPPVLWAVREVDRPKHVLIVEGTKQCLAAASHAPPDVSVYGISGCRSWQHQGMPLPDLSVVDNQHVIVVLDADAADNPQVYRAGIEMADALSMEGAESILFARLPSAGKSGLDDVLGSRPADKRAAYMVQLIGRAKAKPADRVPTGKSKKTGEAPKGDRPTIICNEDRHLVINELTGALLERWNGKELFCHGGVISRLRGQAMRPVDRGSFNDLVQETAMTVNRAEGANGVTYTFSWPDPATMSAALSRADDFAALERISHAPFVREDGSVVSEYGYDAATRTMLVLDPVFEGIQVPEKPTPEQVAAARDLIMTEWLGDIPFDTDADRANALALVLTPAVRGLVPKVPMAVVDGLQMGVGKNLIADTLLTIYTGEAAQPMNWVSEPDELRKQITSAFRTGAEFFVFDEAHTLEGAPLAQALTATTWQDRILGVSTMANFPNRVTWISLGNQVQVRGDITRRVYRISIRPRYANPQDRHAGSFRHPDLASWVRKHRAELMTAILTLVRAWFAAGQPLPKRGVSFGSFEQWERIVGGIVETAGMTDFLGNLKVWRSESDFDTQYWTAHLAWLREQFGTDAFRTSDVKQAAMADPSWPAPPRLDDPSEKGFGKALGEAYSRMRERRMGGFWMQRVSAAHGHVSQWSVQSDDDLPPAPGPAPDPEPPTPGPEPVQPEPDTDVSRPEPLCGAVYEDQPPCIKGKGHEDGPDTDWKRDLHSNGMFRWPVRPQPVEDDVDETEEISLEAGLLAFDLETGDAADLYRADPADYIRIGGTAADDGEVTAYVPGVGSGPKSQALVARAVANDVRRAWVATGHNIMAFDLPALVRTGAMTMPEVHTLAETGCLFDTLLAARFIDPPMARDKGVDATRKYDLGTLGIAYDLGEKMSDTSKALAKKYGGWGNIPIDDSEDGRAFKAYLVQDVELSRALYRALMDKLGGTVPSYLAREHRVAALAAQISVNGFRVDIPLLDERIAEIDERKRTSLQWLAENIGLPLTGPKGEAYKSPLATRAGKDAIIKAFTDAGVSPGSLWRTGKSKDLDTSGEHMRHLAAQYHHLPRVRQIAKEVYRIVGARSVYQTAHNHLCPDGRVHPRIGFDQATGRWSVTSPGLTVFGKRGGRHVERAVFLPDPGEVLISADLSQVDMRAVAGLSQDAGYIRMLLAEDPHAEIARVLFGDPGMREIAKPIGHGWNYGRGIRAISESNDLDPSIVAQFDRSMRDRFPRLVEWQREVREMAESGMLLDNGFGRLMRPDPQRAHTQGPALMGQGAARDIMMSGLLRLPPEILPMLRAQIHDEIVLSVPADQVEEVGRAVVEALSFEWRGVPILADVSRPGETWAACYAKD